MPLTRIPSAAQPLMQNIYAVTLTIQSKIGGAQLSFWNVQNVVPLFVIKAAFLVFAYMLFTTCLLHLATLQVTEVLHQLLRIPRHVLHGIGLVIPYLLATRMLLSGIGHPCWIPERPFLRALIGWEPMASRYPYCDALTASSYFLATLRFLFFLFLHNVFVSQILSLGRAKLAPHSYKPFLVYIQIFNCSCYLVHTLWVSLINLGNSILRLVRAVFKGFGDWILRPVHNIVLVPYVIRPLQKVNLLLQSQRERESVCVCVCACARGCAREKERGSEGGRES